MWFCDLFDDLAWRGCFATLPIAAPAAHLGWWTRCHSDCARLAELKRDGSNTSLKWHWWPTTGAMHAALSGCSTKTTVTGRLNASHRNQSHRKKPLALTRLEKRLALRYMLSAVASARTQCP